MLLPLLLLADTGAAPPPLAHFPPHRRRCCCATPRLNTCPALPHKDEFAKKPPTGDLPPPFTSLTTALQGTPDPTGHGASKAPGSRWARRVPVQGRCHSVTVSECGHHSTVVWLVHSETDFGKVRQCK